MNAIARTSAFKSGNSVAIRVPKVFGVKPGDKFELVRRGNHLEVHPIDDPERDRADLAELARILLELGPTKNFLGREPIEFPDRPGLY